MKQLIITLPIIVLLAITASGQPPLDSDGDGYSDLQELAQSLPAFGPNYPRGNPAVFTSNSVGSSDYPSVEFRCLPGIIHGYGYQVQQSSDLESWSDVDMVANRVGLPVSIDDNNGSPVDLVTVRGNQSLNSLAKTFLRVAISPPWPPDTLRFANVSLSNINEHIRQSALDIIPQNTLTKSIFDSYSTTSNSIWSRYAWTSKVDLSGVPFDDLRDGVLISPRHVLMAWHFQRPPGSTIVFHDRSGQKITRTLVRNKSVPGGLNPDITVGLMDADVTLKFYRVLPPRNDWGNYLVNGLAMVTDQERKLLVKKIIAVGNASIPYLSFENSSDVNDFYDEPLVAGDSGNPSFIMVRGEPVLIETHTFSIGVGPFFSTVPNYTAINGLMSALGGGYQLSPVLLNP